MIPRVKQTLCRSQQGRDVTRMCRKESRRDGAVALPSGRAVSTLRTLQSKVTVMTRLSAVLFTLFLAGVAAAQDRYVGYYHPEISSEETFDRVVRASQGAGKAVRIDFVNVLTTAQLEAPESPRFVFFAKGEGASTLMLIALDDDIFATLYRARALLAQLTVSVRRGGFFRQEDLQYVVTFYDLLQLLQFDELVISDGKTWAHRVNFKR